MCIFILRKLIMLYLNTVNQQTFLYSYSQIIFLTRRPYLYTEIKDDERKFTNFILYSFQHLKTCIL